MLMNFIVIVVTWSAPQCALEAREEEREDALKRRPAPARDPDHACDCAYGSDCPGRGKWAKSVVIFFGAVL